MEQATISGRTFAYNKEDENGDQKQNPSHIVQGPLDKDRVTESRYDILASVQEKTQQLSGLVQTEDKERFREILWAMRNNEHFKEFFVGHEKSLKAGLSQLDKAAGNKYDYFAKKIMHQMLQSNKFRKFNVKSFASMSDKTIFEPSMDQIQVQKRQIIKSISPYRGKKGMILNRLADKDLSNYLHQAQKPR